MAVNAVLRLPSPSPIRVAPIRLPRLVVAPPRITPPGDVVAELARRLSQAVSRMVREAALDAPPVVAPVQLALLDGFDPLDPARVDLAERLPDGSARWISPKQAAWLCHVDPDTICRRVNKFGIGVKIGGRYWIDRTRITGHT